MNEKEILERNIQSYNDTFAKYGPDSPQSLKWGTKQTQYFRFKILSEIADITDAVILDYGCGLGDLLDFLLSQGFAGKYIGVDINERLIAAAKQKYPNGEFIQGTEFPENDYCLISGIFNDRLHDDAEYQLRFLRDTLSKAFQSSRKGIAFNAISTFVEKKSDDTMWHFGPFELGEWCVQNITPFVTVRHDYRRGNFTIYLFKNHGVDF